MDDDTVIDLAGRRGPLSAATRLAISMALRRRGPTPGLDPYVRHPRSRGVIERTGGSVGRARARARGDSRQLQLDAIRRQARARQAAAAGPGQRQTPAQLTQRVNNLPPQQRQALRSRASAPQGYRWNSNDMLEPSSRPARPSSRPSRSEPADHAEQRRAIENVRRRAAGQQRSAPRPAPTPAPRPQPRTPGARVLTGNESVSLNGNRNNRSEATPAPERRARTDSAGRETMQVSNERTTPASRGEARNINNLVGGERVAAYRAGRTPKGYHWAQPTPTVPPRLFANSDTSDGSRARVTNFSSSEGIQVDMAACPNCHTPLTVDLAAQKKGKAKQDPNANKAQLDQQQSQFLKDSGQGNSDFNSKHPRAGAGSPTGGQFIAAGSGGAGSGQQDQVLAAQYALGVGLTGKMSPDDVEAVKSFQRSNGLQVDGKIGRQTAAALVETNKDGTNPNAGRRAAGVKPGALSMLDRAKLAESPNKKLRIDTSLAASTRSVDLAARTDLLRRAAVAYRAGKLTPKNRKMMATYLTRTRKR